MFQWTAVCRESRESSLSLHVHVVTARTSSKLEIGTRTTHKDELVSYLYKDGKGLTYKYNVSSTYSTCRAPRCLQGQTTRTSREGQDAPLL